MKIIMMVVVGLIILRIIVNHSADEWHTPYGYALSTGIGTAIFASCPCWLQLELANSGMILYSQKENDGEFFFAAY